jgi:phosphoglucomutase
LLGLEESHGYLADDAVRDKDANATVLLLCEFAATLRARGRTLLDALDALHLSYGAYAEDLLNVTLEGAAGATAIQRILKSWRTKPPSAIDDSKVVKITDFGAGQGEIVDEDGEPVPREDFLVIDLADGRRVAVRASGTEPKIKFYSYARAVAADGDDLAAARKRARASVLALRSWMEVDAKTRSK